MIRYLTAGESHGQALVAVVEGLPAGLQVTAEDIQAELGRRRLGYGRGPRQRFEVDEIELLGGIRHGRTLGSPVSILIKNTEWFRSDVWHEEMSPAPGATKKPLTQPRPGHADLSGMQKYGFDDARDVLERASARETAARVAAGALAKLLLREIGVDVLSHVIQMGSVRSTSAARPTMADLAKVDESPVRCFDEGAQEAMIAEIEAAAKDGDSLGGVVEVLAYGLPVGLGSYVHWDRKIDGLLSQAIMSIQAVKGVEIGDGFEVAGRRGSAAHDPISWDESTKSYRRESTLAGGTEGGMTTGELLVVRAAMKPLATLNRPTLKTVDTATKEETVSFKERTDVTAVPAMGVVAETMVALVLATEAQRKFGGDSVREFSANAAAFADSLR
ncbi:MAG: chorismate synthase [Actinomycetota bacterium]|jgi:chorismate synthase